MLCEENDVKLIMNVKGGHTNDRCYEKAGVKSFSRKSHIHEHGLSKAPRNTALQSPIKIHINVPLDTLVFATAPVESPGGVLEERDPFCRSKGSLSLSRVILTLSNRNLSRNNLSRTYVRQHDSIFGHAMVTPYNTDIPEFGVVRRLTTLKLASDGRS